MPCSLQTTERCKALLGTFVRIRVEGLGPAQANTALDHCFTELAEIHRLMSFQEFGSDISRLNRDAHKSPVRVDARTFEVLEHAAAVSRLSQGVFDVTVAPHLVRARLNAAPRHAPAPHADARWSDVQLLPGQHVHFARPLWVDVSGIAKGYAVDRAMALLVTAQPAQACVNAGGDLKVWGPHTEQVRLDVQREANESVPVVELKDGSLASSGARQGERNSAALGARYVEAARQRDAPRRFVTVLASSCVIADALTKVVMVSGAQSLPVLRSCRARALMSEGAAWREVA